MLFPNPRSFSPIRFQMGKGKASTSCLHLYLALNLFTPLLLITQQRQQQQQQQPDAKKGPTELQEVAPPSQGISLESGPGELAGTKSARNRFREASTVAAATGNFGARAPTKVRGV
ncbi:unnamed protein product [Polarella glacialis]|uniref:Uncharacterized protein n=1 Tax=Polarella glacialis TaxID=89957 RepID=A0A813E2C2_POLGL|nr:unnamed protein product [Polarella glacialis]CAE8669362.1 unnamed protein product [Polarella glacialis]|mmetsp:Transcript_40539/g.73453  ORF Transcript_40539/g.73453 Transcript_40539/m.73453 type:complete len:116 (+) Transcript_40539:38-385(+)